MHKQKGVSMIEVLIALLVTAAGLLGFAALQGRALESTEAAYARSQAASIAQDMIERVHGALGGMDFVRDETERQAAVASLVESYIAATGDSDVDCAGTTHCTEDEVVDYDLAQVNDIAASVLPSGSAAMGACGTAICAYVAWGETTAADCVTQGGLGDSCVVMVGPSL